MLELKYKAINLYNHFISRLEMGYKDDYTCILNLINFIELYPYLDNRLVIYEYLL